MNKNFKYSKIVEEAYALLNDENIYIKQSQKIENNLFINYMPLKIKNHLFNKTVLRTEAGMVSQYSLFDLSNGKVIDTFIDNSLSSKRTAYTALWCFEKFIEKNDFKSISIIGSEGSIGGIITSYIKENYQNKKLFFASKEEEISKEVIDADIIFSAPRFLEDTISSAESIKKNKLVLAIHARGWHNKLDENFDNILVDVPNQAPWISKKATKIKGYSIFSNPGNYIVYNTGHVVFDYVFYKGGS